METFGGPFDELAKSLQGFREGHLPITSAEIDPKDQTHIARWMYGDEWPYIEDFGYSKKPSEAADTFDRLTNSYGLQTPTTLFRGIGESEPDLNGLRDRLSSFTADKSLATKYYASPSGESRHVLVYKAKPGTPGLPLRLPEPGVSDFANQDEFLMPRGLSWDLSGDPIKRGSVLYHPVEPKDAPVIPQAFKPADQPWDLEQALKRYYGEEE